MRKTKPLISTRENLFIRLAGYNYIRLDYYYIATSVIISKGCGKESNRQPRTILITDQRIFKWPSFLSCSPLYLTACFYTYTDNLLSSVGSCRQPHRSTVDTKQKILFPPILIIRFKSDTFHLIYPSKIKLKVS